MTKTFGLGGNNMTDRERIQKLESEIKQLKLKLKEKKQNRVLLIIIVAMLAGVAYTVFYHS